MTYRNLAATICLVLAASSGCDGGDSSVDVDAQPGTGADAAVDAADPGGCQAGSVACLDSLLLDLSLHDDKISDGTVVNTADGAGWVSVVDATAGGFANAADNPFLYLAFTDAGIVKVEIDDETALESQAWDIAARRFIVRVNSGNSGPGCVAATLAAGSTYEALDSEPASVSYMEDLYYSQGCEMVMDDIGLPGSPDVALGGWWTYDGCVKTEGVPALIRLGDGRVVKFVVDSYYQSGQDTCNETGVAGNVSGMYSWRWAFLGG